MDNNVMSLMNNRQTQAEWVPDYQLTQSNYLCSRLDPPGLVEISSMLGDNDERIMRGRP